MSSVSFPQSYSQGAPSPSSSEVDGPYYNHLPFESSSTGGFQINPLSPHPPRTPRTSIVAPNATVFHSEVFTSKEELEERPVDLEEEIDDTENSPLAKAKQRVRREDVWREMVLTSNGRDKAFKLIQYAIRVYLVFHYSLARRSSLKAPGSSWAAEAVRRLESTAAGLSLTRKCLIMFNWLTPLTSILAETSAPISPRDGRQMSKPSGKPLLHTFLHAPPPVLLELMNGFADDTATLSKLGLIGKRTGERAGNFANWCWFTSTLVNLVENQVERGMIVNSQREVENRAYTESVTGTTAKSTPRNSKIDEQELQLLRRQDYWLQVQRWKLLMDLIFVSYDVFKIKRGSDSVKAITGLASAALSSAKLYDRHHNVLVKSKMSSF